MTRLGIDIGRIDVDAALVADDGEVVATAKIPRFGDELDAIDAVLTAVLVRLPDARIDGVHIATDRAYDAMAEATEPVAVVRVGSASSRAVRPLFGWPPQLRARVEARSIIIDGGTEIDGRPAADLDEDALREFLVMQPRPAAVAVTAVFAGADESVEDRVRSVVVEVLGHGVPISLSNEIGAGSLLARENATILNASLGADMRRFISAVRDVQAAHGLGSSALYLARNDGTVMTAELAGHFPVLTINARVSAMLTGARVLVDARPALVIDMGTESTTLGLLVPEGARSAPMETTAAGIDLDARLPDAVTMQFGARTAVEPDGHRLGDVLENAADPRHAEAHSRVRRELAAAAARLRNEHGLLPVIGVGSAAHLIPSHIPGSMVTVRPPHGEVAGAVGVACADAGGEHERVVNLREETRADAVAQIEATARRHTVRAGASPSSVRTDSVESAPLTYLGVDIERIRVRALGRPD